MRASFATLFFCVCFDSVISELWTNISTEGQFLKQHQFRDPNLPQHNARVPAKGIAYQISSHGPLMALTPYNNLIFYTPESKEWEIEMEAVISVSSCADGTIWSITKVFDQSAIFRNQHLNPPQEVPNDINGTLKQIYGQDANHAVVLTENGKIFVFSDGKSWNLVSDGKRFRAQQVVLGDSDDGKVLYALDTNGTLWVGRFTQNVDWVQVNVLITPTNVIGGKMPVMFGGRPLAAFDVFSSTGGKSILAAANARGNLYLSQISKGSVDLQEQDTPKEGCIFVSLNANQLYCITPDQDIFVKDIPAKFKASNG